MDRQSEYLGCSGSAMESMGDTVGKVEVQIQVHYSRFSRWRIQYFQTWKRGQPSALESENSQDTVRDIAEP